MAVAATAAFREDDMSERVVVHFSCVCACNNDMATSSNAELLHLLEFAGEACHKLGKHEAGLALFEVREKIRIQARRHTDGLAFFLSGNLNGLVKAVHSTVLDAPQCDEVRAVVVSVFKCVCMVRATWPERAAWTEETYQMLKRLSVAALGGETITAATYKSLPPTPATTRLWDMMNAERKKRVTWLMKHRMPWIRRVLDCHAEKGCISATFCFKRFIFFFFDVGKVDLMSRHDLVDALRVEYGANNVVYTDTCTTLGKEKWTITITWVAIKPPAVEPITKDAAAFTPKIAAA